MDEKIKKNNLEMIKEWQKLFILSPQKVQIFITQNINFDFG